MVLETEDHSHKRILILVLLLVSVVLYLPSLQNEFVWDAKGVFVVDPSIRSLRSIPGFFLEPSVLPGAGWSEENPLVKLPYYRPLTKTVHALEYQVFGDRPLGYNLVNIAMNALVVVLAFLVILQVSRNMTAAFLASLLYAVNPAHVEAVSWSYSDSYLFAAALSLLSFSAYVRGRLVLALLIFAASLLVHETAAPLPVVIVLYEFLLRERRDLRSYAASGAFFAVLSAFLLVRRAVAGPLPLADAALPAYANTIAVIVKRFAKLLVVPDARATTYPYIKGMFSGLSAEVFFSYAVLAAAVLVGLLLWSRRRDVLFWYLWFFVMASLSFNIGRFGEYLLFEKLVYLASLGLCAAMGLLIANARRRAALFACCLVLVLYQGAATFDRQRAWRSTVSYFETVLAMAPEFGIGHFALASEYQSRGELDRAVVEYHKTLLARPELAPLVQKGLASAHYEKGSALSAAGNYDEALQQFQKALSWNPDDSFSQTSIGNIYQLQGKYDRALEAWKLAIRSDPANPVPYYNISLELRRRGRTREAYSYYEQYAATTSGRGK